MISWAWVGWNVDLAKLPALSPGVAICAVRGNLLACPPQMYFLLMFFSNYDRLEDCNKGKYT